MKTASGEASNNPGPQLRELHFNAYVHFARVPCLAFSIVADVRRSSEQHSAGPTVHVLDVSLYHHRSSSFLAAHRRFMLEKFPKLFWSG